MTYLPDNKGRLLGGFAVPRFRLRMPPAAHATSSDALEPPLPPEYPPGEIVFALECGYGSFSHRPSSAAVAELGNVRSAMKIHQTTCRRSTEDPIERYDCPSCGGSYCVAHADRDAHACGTAIRKR